jgi:D-3-phosphoglycerate dehydrogenase
MTVVLVNQAMADGMDEVFGPRDDIECRVVEDQTESALLRHIPGVHGLVLGLAAMTPHVIEAAAGALKVVSRRGVGYDNVDLAALTRAGIPLTVVGSANSVSVAEHTLHLMLALAKQSHVQDARLRRATWNDARLVRPVDLARRRVLVLGLGRIGRLLVSRLLALDMEVLVHDPFVDEAEIAATGATAAADWRAALPAIDFLTVNCPKTPETTGMVGAPELAAMKRTAFLVNTARGGIIDETALYTALRDHAIGGAGIDAFDQEPAAPDHPLFELDNAIFTPHVAGLTTEAVYRMNVRAAQNVVDACDGVLDPQFVVNREVLETPE